MQENEILFQVSQIVSATVSFSGAVAKIRCLIERHRGFERARERAQSFTDKARCIIGEFPESPYQRALSAVTDLVTDRDH